MKPRVYQFKNYLEALYDRIKGLKYGDRMVLDIELNQNTTIEQVMFIVSQLDYRMLLRFYDAYFQLPPDQQPAVFGDSGAFAEVKKQVSL